MFRRTRRKAAVAGLLVFALVLAACGGDDDEEASGDTEATEEEGTPVQGGTLRVGAFTVLDNYDPAKCGFSAAFGDCGRLYGTLLRWDAQENEFVYDIAESLESSDGGTTWTLKLRSGIDFSDGTPLDAAAVVANWDRVRDPALASPGKRDADSMQWKVVNPTTVEITLAAPNTQLEWTLTGTFSYIGSPTAITERGPDFATKPIGAGPFLLESVDSGHQSVMTRNPTYWRKGKPYLDKVITTVIAADDQRYETWAKGQLDVFGVYYSQWSDKAIAEKDAQVLQVPEFIIGSTIQFSLKVPPMDDQRIRLAVGKLYDPAEMIAAVDPGAPIPTELFPPGSPYRGRNQDFAKPDLEGAQKLIDEYLADTGKSELRLEFVYIGGSPVHTLAAQVFQAQMQRAKGVKVDLDGSTAAFGEVGQGKRMIGLNAVTGQSPLAIYDFLHSKGTRNVFGYSNPKVDAALEEAKAAEDRDDQIAAYQKAGAEFVKDPMFRVYRYLNFISVSTKAVHGLPNFEETWLEAS